MKLQSKTVANIQLSIEDIREALAQYITNNGFAVTAQDLPIDTVEEGLSIDLEVVSDTAPVTQASKTTTRRSPAKKQEPAVTKCAADDTPAADKTEVVGTQVPDADIAAYRAKKAAEAKAKEEVEKAEAKPMTPEEESAAKFEKEVDEIINDTFADFDGPDGDDELEDLEMADTVPATPVKTTNLFVEEVAAVKTTTSVFDDDEIPTQTASAKTTENLFA